MEGDVHRVRVSGIAAASLAVLLAACGEAPTAARGSAHAVAPTAHAAQRGSGRYRDSGTRPATGRSGSAAVQAEAFLLPGGAIRLLLTASRAREPDRPAGVITKAQVKVLDAAGRGPLTANENRLGGNPVTIALPPLMDGVSLRALVHVGGLDGRRTDVVAVAGIMPVPAPDLAAVGVSAPPFAIEGVPTIVTATLAETGGARGASGNCVLYVDGQAADRVWDVWVDAGDRVTCAFTHAFAAGTRRLRVVLEDVTPYDADPANDAAEARVLVYRALAVVPDNFTAGADVRDGLEATADSFLVRWTDRAGRVWYEAANAYVASGRVQTVNLAAVVGAPTTLPFTRLYLAARSGGRLVYERDVVGFGAAVGSAFGCALEGEPGGVEVVGCAYDLGYAVVSFLRYAGTVTYLSRGYSLAWNGSAYEADSWVDNWSDAAPVFARLTDDFAFTILVEDGGIAWQLGGGGPLLPFSTAGGQPWACTTDEVSSPPELFDVLSCAASSYRFTGIAGSAMGAGRAAVTGVPPAP